MILLPIRSARDAREASSESISITVIAVDNAWIGKTMIKQKPSQHPRNKNLFTVEPTQPVWTSSTLSRRKNRRDSVLFGRGNGFSMLMTALEIPG